MNIVDLLRDRAQATPDLVAFTFLGDGENITATRTWGQLEERARSVAASLQVVAGERVLLALEEGIEFLDAWYGCVWAGVLAAPVQAPDPRRPAPSIARLRFVAQDAGVSKVLTTRGLVSTMEALGHPVVAVEEIPHGDVAPNPQHIAYLQYTSGSTSEPKGVCITHDNLLHHLREWHEVFEIGADDVVVTWLPATHDLGMVHARVMPVFKGQRCVFFAPPRFVERPARWARAMSRFGATHSAAPNFGFELAARRPKPEELEGVELSRVKMILNGAEPVRRDTMERFHERYAAHGLRRSAGTHAFGMSEATCKITNEPLGRAGQFVDIDAAAYEQNEIVFVPRGTPNARTLASNGPPQRDNRVVIADPVTHERLPERRVGEVWAAGPLIGIGYWHREELSDRVFRARTADGDGPFLRTGDLGFLHEGEVYISGRLKDVIIIRGQNHHPPDLELQLEGAHASVRPGGVAVFSLPLPSGEESIGVVAEVNPDADLPAVASALRASLFDGGLSASTVALVGPRGLPKTSSGKTQRAEARAQLLAGVLPALHRSDTLRTA